MKSPVVIRFSLLARASGYFPKVETSSRFVSSEFSEL